MGKAKTTRKFAQMKRMINPNDSRIVKNQQEQSQKQQEAANEQASIHNVPQMPTCMFFKHNEALGPPYHIIIDTNFINFSIKNKLDVMKSMLDCLFAKCIPYVTDCVLGELEKLGPKYRLALRIARDPRFERLPCMHKGTYADDCIVQRVTQHRCFIVATCDKELKSRIRRIPGVPLMSIVGRKYAVEQLSESY